MHALDKAVVRIYGPAGGIVGAGFLAAADLILTCHHVVKASEVALDFPLWAAGQRCRAQLIRDDEARDIAVLRLLGKPPAGAEPLRLVTPKET